MSDPARLRSDSPPMSMPDRDGGGEADPSRPEYDSDYRSVYWIRYYVLMVTRRRRPFFEDEKARARCEELMGEVAEQEGCRVVSCEVRPSRVIVEVLAPPTISPHSLVTRLRHDAAGPLKAEFPEIETAGGAFAHRYMVTTVPMPEGDREGFESLVPR